jgi:hypothetical protein
MDITFVCILWMKTHVLADIPVIVIYMIVPAVSIVFVITSQRAAILVCRNLPYLRQRI